MQEHGAHSSQLTDLPWCKKVVFLALQYVKGLSVCYLHGCDEKEFSYFNQLNPRDSIGSQ